MLSRYVLGGRDIKLAVKLKPDYLDGGLDDLDMLILGGFYGSKFGSFVFKPICRVFIDQFRRVLRRALEVSQRSSFTLRCRGER